jgi:hypothetical protein
LFILIIGFFSYIGYKLGKRVYKRDKEYKKL